MLLPIYIDTRDLSEEFNLSKKDVEALVDDAVKAVTLEFYREWTIEASSKLKSTRQRYLDSLVMIDEGLMKGAVVLRYEDPLVRMLEEGATPFDMKEGFRNSPKAKWDKKGNWYLTIPYRSAASGSLGESDAFSGILPESVYKQVKSLQADIPLNSGMRSRGLTEGEIPSPYDQKTVRKKIPKTPTTRAYEEYVSKTSPYVGMMKIKDGTTGQNRYMSFRRVSSNSDPNSWIHKGFNAKDFAGQALDNLDIETVMDIAVDNFLSQI